MRKLIAHRLGPPIFAGCLSAILLVLSFPPYNIWPLAFVGLVPLLFFVFRAKSVLDAFCAGLACSMLFIIAGFTWVSFVTIHFGELPWLVGQLILFIYSLFGEPEFLILAVATYFVANKGSHIQGRWHLVGCFFILPLFYIGIDYLYPKIFPNTLGHVLYHWFSIAQIAEYTGVFGLTLPIVLVNLALTVLLANRYHSAKDQVSESKWVPFGILLAVAVGLFACDRWGRQRLLELEAIQAKFQKSFRFSVIQANIGDIDKIASETGSQQAVKKVLATYKNLSQVSIARFHPHLVIWPETAYPLLYSHNVDELTNPGGAVNDRWIQSYLTITQTPLFFGGYSALNRRDFNSAFLVTPPFELKGLYQKSILLPFGEYIPLGPLAPLVNEIVPAIANFGRGHGPYSVELDGLKFGPQICYEGIIPEHSRRSVKEGADVLLNITNDSWFGDSTEPWLHLHLTLFRAIELRRPIIRGTNTGISALVDFTGQIKAKTRLFTETIFEQELKIPALGYAAEPSIRETFFLKHGELFAKLCALFGFTGLAVILLRRRW